jgi:Uma2 family endonuclease
MVIIGFPPIWMLQAAIVDVALPAARSPLLVIEVVSPQDERSDNCQRDYLQKPKEYAERGIPEYWIVDPERAVIRVGCLVGEVYDYGEFRDGDVIISPAFPGWTLTAAEILAAGQ